MKLLSFFLPIAHTATALAQTLNIVAHEDDDLLFLSPNLLHEVQSGRRIRTIFITAGDAGNDASYWTSRQEGSKAAYARMSNVSNSWTQSDAGVPGFNIPLFTLNNNPNISLAFLQLPDGNNGGEGFGLGSLQHLWEGSIDSLTSFSGSSYSKHALVDVLRKMANDFGCDNIRTQDFVHGYGEGDHSDHLTTAYFVREAFDNCDVGKPITSYMGYPVESLAVNIDDETLAQKKAAFYTYAGYDRNTCSSDESCRGRSEEAWVQREHVVAEVDQAHCRAPKRPNARNKGKAMAGKPLAQS